MDVLAVTAAVQHARNWIRAGKGPLVFEMTTYRFYGHSVSDPDTSQSSREDVRAVRAKEDQVVNYQKILLDDLKICTDEELKEIEREVQADVDAGVAETEEMPFPEATPTKLFEDSYVGGSEPRSVRGRTPDEDCYFGRWCVDRERIFSDR